MRSEGRTGMSPGYDVPVSLSPLGMHTLDPVADDGKELSHLAVSEVRRLSAEEGQQEARSEIA